MNINPSNFIGLPDVEVLQKLANSLFLADSTKLLSNKLSEESLEESTTSLGTELNLDDLSSSVDLINNNLNFEKNLDSHSFSSNNIDHFDIGFVRGDIPASVAGSGISPSFSNEKEFNVKDPQTSLLDPHFKDGQIPASVSGSGKQSSYQNTNFFTPQQNTIFHTQNLTDIFSQVENQLTSNQLPFNFTNLATENQFYFLNQQNNNSLLDPNIIFPVNLYRQDFPILKEKVNGKPLIWLDNAATTQKPQCVIDRLSHFYKYENSNIHRAAHEIAARATDAYEDARKKVKCFLNASSVNEIIFVRGTTEAINLVAQSWGDQNLKEGDEIIISNLEHHANIVPWQLLAKKKGLNIKVIPVDDTGQIIIEEYTKLFTSKTKLVSITHVSNALGTITPVKKIIEIAHSTGAKVLLDGAQSVSHIKIDLQDLNPDWFVFSGHKVFGPTGIGVLYGKEEILNNTQPWQGGGNMIQDVTFEHTIYHLAPHRFEAGTGNIADAVGLGAALEYVSKVGMDLIHQYEDDLLRYAINLLKGIPGLTLIGTAKEKASVMSFILKGFTNDEVGQELNKNGIAVRTGHHCAQPILRRFGLESTVRPSLAFYNTFEEIDTLVETIDYIARPKNFFF